MNEKQPAPAPSNADGGGGEKKPNDDGGRRPRGGRQ